VTGKGWLGLVILKAHNAARNAAESAQHLWCSTLPPPCKQYSRRLNIMNWRQDALTVTIVLDIATAFNV